MPNQLITEGNYDENIHGYLKRDCDAFGNKVEPPEGYRLLDKETIEPNDAHFDIYGGWTYGHSNWYDGLYARSEGRWRAWARKIK